MKTRLAMLFVLASAFVVPTFARTYPFVTDHTVPGATGSVATHFDKNGNTIVMLKVDRLAKPSELTPPGNIYIVWFQQQGQPPEKEGQLVVNNKLKGELETTTMLKNFKVFVTSETDPTANAPSGQQVLQTTVQD